jgi:tetratricopeptide (TPR) repeat protein
MAVGYGVRDAAKLLGLTEAQVRRCVRAGLVGVPPARGQTITLSFQDQVLLRTAVSLLTERIPMRRVRAALRRLAAQLPEGRPLSGVRISAEGDAIVVRDGAERWVPESGQCVFDFEVSELEEKITPLHAARAPRGIDGAPGTAEDWFLTGLDLEPGSADEARDAYRRALELDPSHLDARLNLGRLLHEAGQVDAAEAHYRVVIDARPDDATAWFNLGVALEDREQLEEAVSAYRLAIELDPDSPDPYWNLGQLYERTERPALAARYLGLYRELAAR